MALLRFDNNVSLISGRLGTQSSTFTRNHGAPVLRAQIGPSNPDTDDQQAVRAIFSAITKEWKLLTQTQRNAWTAFAQANVVTNRLGNPVGRNGISAFLELNFAYYIQNLSVAHAAPTLPRPAPITQIDLSGGLQSGGNNMSFVVNHAYTSTTGFWLFIRATPAFTYESQNPKISDYRLIRGVSNASTIGLDVSGTLYSMSSTKYSYADTNWAALDITIYNAEGWQSIPVRQHFLYST